MSGGARRGMGASQLRSPEEAYPVLLLLRHPEFFTLESFGIWLVQAAMMGA